MNLTDSDLARPRTNAARTDAVVGSPVVVDWLAARLTDRTGEVAIEVGLHGGFCLFRVPSPSGASSSSLEVPVRHEPSLATHVAALRRHLRALGHSISSEHATESDARIVVAIAPTAS